VLAYTLPVIVATALLGSLLRQRAAGRVSSAATIEHAAATAEGLFVLFHTLSLAWNIDFGLALLWNRHVGVAGGEGRRGVFGTALAQRQDLYVALATALQIICRRRRCASCRARARTARRSTTATRTSSRSAT
jgi:hypothetical protein